MYDSNMHGERIKKIVLLCLKIHLILKPIGCFLTHSV